MGGASFQDALRRRQAAGFVARSDELARFRANLALSADAPGRRFIFSVHGDGGVGKTYLSGALRDIARGQGAATAWVDERLFGVPEAMRTIAGDLSRAGEDMSAFEKVLGNYMKRRLEVEADPNAPAGTAAFITQMTVRAGLHAAHAVPGIGGIADSLDPVAAAEQADRLRSFLGKKFRRHEDVRLLLSPVEALSPAFVGALSRVGRHRPLALFFDTYEQTGTFLDGWLRSVLDGDYGGLPANLVVTVAGRRPLDRNAWSGYAAVLASVPLLPFTEAEARQLLADKGITDERVVQVIVTLSGRLPLLVATLAESRPADPSQVGDLSGDAVDRFLKWEADPVRRFLAVAAALPRAVNEDILGVLAPATNVGTLSLGELFDWLRSLPFIRQDAGRCTYHEVVRRAMLRQERSQSPTRWRERHQTLAAACRRWGAGISEHAAWADSGWRDLRLEETYHLLCGDPARTLPGALADVVHVLDQGRAAAAQWAQMIQQAGDDAGADIVLDWGQRLAETLRGTDEDAVFGCADLLLREQRVTEPALPLALRLRGRALYFLNRDDEALIDLDRTVALSPCDKYALAYRAEARAWQDRHADALADFNRAIELDPGFGRAVARRGWTYWQLGRHDEAIADLNRAIELDPDDQEALSRRGWMNGQLGRRDEAIADLNRAIELDPDDEEAIGRRGFTYQDMGRYDEAVTDIAALLLRLWDEPVTDYNLAANRGTVYRQMGRNDEAVAELDRAIEIDPNSDWAVCERGLAYAQMNRYEEAIADLTTAIGLNPDNDRALTIRGKVYRLTKRYDAAIADFSRAATIDPGNAEALGSRGQAYGQTGRHEDAVADLDRAIDLDPEAAWLFFERGGAHAEMGHLGEAIADFGRAIELDPGYAEAFLDRGIVYEGTDRHDEALADYNRAIELDRGNALALARRGVIHYHRGRYDEAVADLSEAIELGRESAWPVALRGEAYLATARYDEAIADYDRAIGIDPDDLEVISKRGVAYQRSGRYEMALSDFRHVIEREPGYAGAFADRAVTCHLMGRDEEALDDFRRAIELNGEFAWMSVERGQICMDLGRFDEAVADFSRAIEVQPDHAGALASRGEAHLVMMRYGEAIADLTRAIELNPGDAWLSALRGVSYLYEHRHKEAIADLNQAIDLDPAHAPALAVLGHAYRVAGQPGDALQPLLRAIEIAPDVDWEHYELALAYACLGDRDQMNSRLQHAVELVTSNAPAHLDVGDTLNLAIYRLALREPDLARACILRALAGHAHPYYVRQAVLDLRDLGTVPGMDVSEIEPLIEILQNDLSASEGTSTSMSAKRN